MTNIKMKISMVQDLQTAVHFGVNVTRACKIAEHLALNQIVSAIMKLMDRYGNELQIGISLHRFFWDFFLFCDFFL